MEDRFILLLLCTQCCLSRLLCSFLGSLYGKHQGSNTSQAGHHAERDKQHQSFGCQVRLRRDACEGPLRPWRTPVSSTTTAANDTHTQGLPVTRMSRRTTMP